MLFEGKTTIEVHLLTYLITEIPESDIFLALLEFDDTLDPNISASEIPDHPDPNLSLQSEVQKIQTFTQKHYQNYTRIIIKLPKRHRSGS